MTSNVKIRILLQFFLVTGLVLALSYLSSRIWGEKSEKISTPATLVIEDGMTVNDFGRKNNLPGPVLKNIFDVKSKKDLSKNLNEFNFSHKELIKRTSKNLAIFSEHESKNWKKIVIKFGLWFSFLILAFVLLRRGVIKAKNRKFLYLISVIVFGILLGSDPNPMGTIKDALVLLATKGVIFPPRMIALALFLITVFVANKFICSWGCQLGTLQDLIFRLNRNVNDTRGIFRQYKIPFVISNSIRIAFFITFIFIAFLWSFDIVEVIDPFKIFNPAMIKIAGWMFLGIILMSSLFIYRPWCHLFCPFGLTGWMVEKLAVFKINVDYKSCTACEACAKACPSNVMDTILKQDKVIPDCFSCGSCIEVCPTDAIRFTFKRREKPPQEMFTVKKLKVSKLKS